MLLTTKGERMNRRHRARYWVEIGLCVTCGLLLLLTLVMREWIELFFGVDPDGGGGALEWLIVACLALLTLVFSALARRERRRPVSARTASQAQI
jgi:hypothetical protein